MIGSMKITRIRALPLNVPAEVEFSGFRSAHPMAICLVTVETDSGIVGHGMTAITDAQVAATAIEAVLAPALVGQDPLRHEQAWDRMYWLLAPRGQTGVAGHAIAAVDTALWDIKGKALGQPVWRLLGGARERVAVYTTFGFPGFDLDQLVEAARHWTAAGSRRLKMVVGHQALQRRDGARTMMDVIREDARRVRAVRDAIGPDVQLYIDANCGLDLSHAVRLAQWIDDCDISFFEEPVTQNDVAQMAELKRRTGMPVAAGQNEGLLFRFRDMIQAGAIDYVQPNTVISGGYTQCLKIAAYAAAHNLPVVNGGAWPFHNMHLQGGVANGTMVEYHHFAVMACARIFPDLPEPVDGWMQLPETPGLGFEPDLAAAQELLIKP
jgi:L-alanine-DL-glutamate epimerase-like enolase superfamily enzyme